MALPSMLLVACSGDNKATSTRATGGVDSSGAGSIRGTGAGGSITTSAGMSATGEVGGGGTVFSGGATAAGGMTRPGGASATGGASGTAGVLSSGGRTGSGGTSAAGTGAGGTQQSGGLSVTVGTTTGGAGGRGSSAGGATGTGGASTQGRGGTTSAGGASGTSGSGGTTSADGCPLTLEGFATLNADGQDGTYGGRDGETVTVTNQADLTRYVTATQPYTIRVQGKITISPKGTELKVASDKTIIGVGLTGEIDEGGFFLGVDVHNVIIRNLTIGNTKVPSDTTGKEYDYDGIQMDTAHHVWIDHCTFHDINDGMIDSRKDTTYVTTSWNVLHDHNKVYGIGWTENVTAQMTIHHNILRDTNQRNPSTDNVLRAHLYNNWLLRVESYGNYSRQATNMVIENSVFDQVNDPYYYDTGTLVVIGNITRNTTGQKESTGTSYSFFDPHKFYQYTLDAAGEVEALLTKCAGPRAELGK
jgi:pectate lyase